LAASSFYDAKSLIPHSGPMRLIERIIDPNENGVTAEATVRESWPLYRKGEVSSVICLELMAQTMCALSTCLRGPGAAPGIGLLVGVREVRFFAESIPVGTLLTIRVKKISLIGDYGVYSGEVSSGLAAFARATVQGIEPKQETIDELYATGRAVK